MENNTIFDSIGIQLASPDQIRSWSYGEVKKPETINYRTLKPERDGLFCERIFGPTKDWECHCGKYKRIRYKGKICEKCGVEVTKAKVRRERMGHIELAAPVSHIWYFKGIPSRIGLMLDVSPKALEQVLYFSKYIVIDPGDTPLQKKDVIGEALYDEMREKYEDDFVAGMGAEAIKTLLEEIDLDALYNELKEELDTATGQKRVRLIKRLDVVESFKLSGQRPEWMILSVVPVIPPDIRPMVQLDGGRFATSDLNDLYRRVINRNNRLQKLLELHAPEIIIRNEKRMLQEAVDALIDNGRRGRPVTGPNNRPLKSLSDMLKGKQGRFRQNLLGKRVDYSGRSVIVVGPELKMYQCGLPKEMALELFKPFVMKRLVETGATTNIKSARKMVERAKDEVWDALEVVIKDHPVLLNRAPTLHRLGIQAFLPVLVEGRAIKLHPLSCTAFNADFDGDQMAVHVPLSAEAQAEARILMLASNNLLKLAYGNPVTVPTQDMILGSYYLTLVKYDEPGAPDKDNEEQTIKRYASREEAMLAYDNGIIGIHVPIYVRFKGKNQNGEDIQRLVKTTVGFMIFNDAIPQDLGFIDRTVEGHELDLEISMYDKNGEVQKVKKKNLGKIIDRTIKVHGITRTSETLDKIKDQGYKYSTLSGITVSVADIKVPEKKKELLAEADAKADAYNTKFQRGWITAEEKEEAVINTWEETDKKVFNALMDSLDEFNPIYMMADSGARGSSSQIKQLAGMRGYIANTSGKRISIPITASYREGLTVLEYFISSRGARKGLADTALRTADSGYLTRRLVDVSQDVIIREDDCGSTMGIEVYDIKGIEKFEERLTGRFLINDLVDPDSGELIQSKNEMMDEDDANRVAAKVRELHVSHPELFPKESIEIRSVLNCRAKHGVCKHCYGSNLSNHRLVSSGEAVGIIAAQSIGEPGTQLTMRTFHTGGVASAADITQGLPRVEELFEARKPKHAGFISGATGIVRIQEVKKYREILITDEESAEEFKYAIPFGYRITVEDGQHVNKGDMLTDGQAVYPHDVLEVNGIEAVQDYIISQVQSVYRMQGVDINDKHIEVIVRQMMRKAKVEEQGSTDFIAGATYERAQIYAVNEEIKARIAAGETNEDGTPLRECTYTPILLGITKASLATDSFLSAASFQETTRVLTDAAIKGKTDPLMGLKENVIIGKLIPAGTGTMEMPEELDDDATTIGSEVGDLSFEEEDIQVVESSDAIADSAMKQALAAAGLIKTEDEE